MNMKNTRKRLSIKKKKKEEWSQRKRMSLGMEIFDQAFRKSLTAF